MKNKSIYKVKSNLVSTNPYVYKTPSVSAKAIRIIVMLGLQIILLGVTKSFSALKLICATTLGAAAAYSIHYVFYRKQHFAVLNTIIQGIMIGMLLPESYPVVTAFFISFFVIFISKYIFANCITSWVNVIAIAVIVAWFIGQRFFPGYQVTSDIISLKNPSVFLIQNGTFKVFGFDTFITNFLNNTVLSWLKVTLPEGIISILCDTQSVIPAFRFNLLTIFASIVLFSDDSYSSLIPSVFIISYLMLVRLLFPVMVGGEFNQGDIILAMCSSGTLFITVFIIAWFGTHPMTTLGKIIYGIIAGVIAFFIVGCGTSPIGMIYTVLICNVLNLIIRVIEEKRNENLVCKLV